MNSVERILFSPWLSRSDRDNVQANVKENFEFISYLHRERNVRFIGLHNRVTGEVMWDDPTSVVGFKCVMVSIGNPFHMVIRTIYEIAMYPWRLALALYRFDPWLVGEAALKIIKVPYYCLGIELAALLGIIYKPLKARARIGAIERNLNEGKPFGSNNTFFLARCCQPWVRDIAVSRKFQIISTGATAESVGHGNSDEFVPCCCLPLIPCCV